MELRQESELTLRDLFIIYRRRQTVVYGVALAVCILCAVYCAVTTRRYEARGTVQIQKESSDGLGLDSLMSESEGAGQALDANIIIQTQASIIESDTLALHTIEKLKMEQSADFRPRWSPVGWILGMVSPAGEADRAGGRLEDSPQRRLRALRIFAGNLKVKPVSGTQLIEIRYLSSDPRLAAAVVNELALGLVDYTFQTRYNATNQASTWLTGQLGELRKQSEDLQEKVVNLQRDSGVYSLGTVDAQGREQAYSGVLDRLQQATSALTQAQQNRILKGAIAQASESGNAEMLSGLAGNGMAGSMSMNSSLTLIQNLRQQEASQRASLEEAEAKYGSSYPKLAELRGNISGLQRSIHEEVQRIAQRAASDYAVAVKEEAATRQQYEDAKRNADTLNDKAIEFSITRQEAEQSRGLYEDLLKRLKEAGVLEGLKSSNITVVDPGRIPARPKRPDVPLYMGIAIVAGQLLGLGSGFVVDTLDNKINGIAEVEEITGTRILGATPLYEGRDEEQNETGGPRLISLLAPQSTYTEALRAIRTAILFTGGDSKCRVILVTSSIAGEGKTTFAANLSVVLAHASRKVLLVDMDLRRGMLRRKLDLTPGPGLSELLAGQQKHIEPVELKQLPGLDVLQAGTIPPNPSELLDRKMGELIGKWRERYDFVVLDGAPMLPVTDSVIVNELVDITLLLSRTGLTERPQLSRSYRILKEGSNHFVGVILNGLRPADENYYGYYGYRKYSYYYGGHENEMPK